MTNDRRETSTSTLTTDVVVVGGGTAGTIAAIAAAERGVSVVLVERDSRVGGVGVQGGIHFYYIGGRGGVQDQVDKDTRAWQRVLNVNRARSFSPEAKWLALESRLRRLGVHVLYSAALADVIVDESTVKGIVAATDAGPVTIFAEVTIDATGDGDVAALAGAEFNLGREWDGAQHTYSLVPRYAEAGVLDYSNYDVGWVDATSARDVTRAYQTARKYVWRDEETPMNTHWISVGPQLGVREGRAIVGDYVLSQDDFLLDRAFPDTVMRSLSHHDTHTLDYANESDESQVFIPVLGLRMFKFGGRVPYRALLPRGLEGLLVGCRALSQTHDCGMGFRMQRDMHKVGEVAGVAAAEAVRSSQMPRYIDRADLQRVLIARGVLDPRDLDRPPMPWIVLPESGTSVEGLRTANYRPSVRDCVAHLGGDNESQALWWLMQIGDSAVPELSEALGDSDWKVARGAALGLGLLGHAGGVPLLLAAIDRRDPDIPADELGRAEERWIAALIVLRLLQDPAAADRAIDMLRHEAKSTTLLYVLRYLGAIAPQLDEEQRASVEANLRGVLNRPDLGADFLVQGSGDVRGTRSDASSIRWSIEILASYVLSRVGADADGLLERARADARGYVRRYADVIEERLARERKEAIHA